MDISIPVHPVAPLLGTGNLAYSQYWPPRIWQNVFTIPRPFLQETSLTPAWIGKEWNKTYLCTIAFSIAITFPFYFFLVILFNAVICGRPLARIHNMAVHEMYSFLSIGIRCFESKQFY